MPEDDLDLSELKGALDRATPRPDPVARAAHLRIAQGNFDRLHAAPAGTAGKPARGGWAGVRRLLGSIAHPGAATATTAVAVLALLMVTPAGRDILSGPLSMGEADGPRPPEGVPEEAPTEPEAPLPAPSAAPEAVALQEAPAAAGTSPPAPAGKGADASATLAPAAPEAARSALPGAGQPAAAAGSAPAPVPAAPPATAPAEAAPAAPDGAAASVERMAEADATAALTGEAMDPAAAAPSVTAQALSLGEDGAAASAERSLGDMVALAPPAASEPFGGVAASPGGPADSGATSFAAVRAAVTAGVRPSPATVDVQGLVDHLAAPPAAPAGGGAALVPSVSAIPAPWDPSARLLVVFVRATVPVGAAELVPDGLAAGEGAAIPLGTLEAGDSAVRVLEAPPGAGGTLRLRWTDPGTGQRREAKAPVAEEGSAPPEARFAAAVAGWAFLLREGAGRLGEWGGADAAALAEAGLGKDPAGLRAEAVRLMRLSDDPDP